MNAGTYASSIAFFAFVSLVPLLALCISLVTLLGVGEQETADFFASLFPGALEGFVRGLIADAFKRSGLALSLSTILLLWSASKGVKALRKGLNSAFSEEESRSGPVVAAISIAAVLILGVLVAAVIYLVLNKSLINLFPVIASTLEGLGLLSMAVPIVIIILGILVLAACYAYLPAGKRRYRSQLPGAVFAVLACGVLSLGFRVYIDHFNNYTVLYGSLATVMLLLMWMYLMSYILVGGGFLNRCIARRKDA